MADLVLYGNVGFTSPYVLSVFVALEEKGLDYELRLLDLARGEHQTDDYRDVSLTNRVPSLGHANFWISESSAITEYLDEVFPPPAYPRLYPEGAQQRARVRQVQALIRSDFMPIREERSTATIFEWEAAQPLSAVAQQSVERLFGVATRLVGGRAYLVGDFTLADVDLATMLQRLIKNGDEVPPSLRSYADYVWERPSVQKWLARTPRAQADQGVNG